MPGTDPATIVNVLPVSSDLSDLTSFAAFTGGCSSDIFLLHVICNAYSQPNVVFSSEMFTECVLCCGRFVKRAQLIFFSPQLKLCEDTGNI